MVGDLLNMLLLKAKGEITNYVVLKWTSQNYKPHIVEFHNYEQFAVSKSKSIWRSCQIGCALCVGSAVLGHETLPSASIGLHPNNQEIHKQCNLEIHKSQVYLHVWNLDKVKYDHSKRLEFHKSSNSISNSMTRRSYTLLDASHN